MNELNSVVRVIKSDGAIEHFRSTYPGERFAAGANDHGDLIVSRWNYGDPYEVHHTVAIFAAGQWARVDQGFDSQPPTD